MKYPKLFIITWVMLLIGASMAMAAEFDNVKTFIPDSKYGSIRVDNLWGIGSTLAEYTLDKNTDECFMECESEGTATLYYEDRLFSSFRFIDKYNTEKNIRDLKILLKVTETLTREVPEYREVCQTEALKNGSNSCTQKQEGVRTEEYTITKEVPYNYEPLRAGVYEWKIKGIKDPLSVIDWLPTAYGKEFNEWAFWNSSWIARVPIIEHNNGTATKTNSPEKFCVSFPNNNVGNCTKELRLTECAVLGNSCENTAQTEITSFVYYETYSGGYCNYACLNFKVSNITSGNNRTYYLYLNNSNVLAPTYTNQIYAWDNFENDSFDSSMWSSDTLGGSYKIAVNKSSLVQSYANAGGFKGFYTAKNASANFVAEGLNWIEIMGGSGFHQALTLGTDAKFYSYHEALGYYYGEGDLYPRGCSAGGCDTSMDKITLEVNLSRYGAWFNGALQESSGGYVSNNVYFACYGVGAGTTQMRWDNVIVYEGAYGNVAYNIYNQSLIEYVGTETEEVTNDPTVLLITPINNYLSTSHNITFNCTALVTQGTIANITLYLNDNANLTQQKTTASAYLYATIYGIPNGEHTWYCNATGNEGGLGGSSSRTFQVHDTVPVINITNYTSNIIVYSLPVYTAINWTVFDTLFNSSWLYNGTNTSALCDTSGNCGLTIPVSEGGQKTYYIYANDSFNIINRTEFNITVYYITSVLTESANEIIEGQSNTLTLTVNLSGIDIPDTNATLYWNNTNYGQGTKVKLTDTSYRYTNTFIVPYVGSVAGTVIPYYWTYNISGLSVYKNSSIDNQTVKQIQLAFDCTDGNNVTVINFSVYTEPGWIGSYEGNFTSTFKIWTDSKVANKTFHVNTYQKQNFTLCIYPNNTIYYADMRSELSGTDYASRTYYLNNITLNSSRGNELIVNLYMLATASGTVTNIYTYDAQDNGLPNKYVTIDRYDVSTDTYKTVEIVNTDDAGHAVAFLRQNDAFYRFIVKDYPNLITLVSEDRQLTTANVQLYPGQSTFTSLLETVDGIYHTLTYDGPTLTFNAEFIGTSTFVTGCLLVEKKTMQGTTQICNDCVYGTSGSVHCTIDNTTGTYHATFYNKINPYGAWDFMEKVISTTTKLTEKIGIANANFLCMLIILVIALATSFNPVTCVISTTVAVAALVGIGLFDLGLTSFIFIVIIAIILASRLKS